MEFASFILLPCRGCRARERTPRAARRYRSSVGVSIRRQVAGSGENTRAGRSLDDLIGHSITYGRRT